MSGFPTDAVRQPNQAELASSAGSSRTLTPMDINLILLVLTFAPGIAGIFALWHEAAWKLSTETTSSPDPLVCWLYRYLLFSFWFMLSFLLVSPVTIWHLIEFPVVHDFGRTHPWLLFALNAMPALILYLLHRRFVRWTDPGKIEARKELEVRAPGAGR
jgi:hypothetical protein